MKASELKEYVIGLFDEDKIFHIMMHGILYME
jgi:hypothetical protein